MKQKDIVRKIKRHFDTVASEKIEATSPDYNLREVEIYHISKRLRNGLRILDLGCGNGYSTLMYASKYKSEFLGLDYSAPMIKAANRLRTKIRCKGKVKFEHADVMNAEIPLKKFDIVITQRLMINLQSRNSQKKMFNTIHRILKPGGIFLMCEATIQGLQRLNEIRKTVGLKAIPNTTNKQWWSLKFDEKTINDFLKGKFSIEYIQPFGWYFFVSRVVHPLLVAPKNPKYNAKINAIAKKVETNIDREFMDIGHQRLFVLKKK